MFVVPPAALVAILLLYLLSPAHADANASVIVLPSTASGRHLSSVGGAQRQLSQTFSGSQWIGETSADCSNLTLSTDASSAYTNQGMVSCWYQNPPEDQLAVMMHWPAARPVQTLAYLNSIYSAEFTCPSRTFTLSFSIGLSSASGYALGDQMTLLLIPSSTLVAFTPSTLPLAQSPDGEFFYASRTAAISLVTDVYLHNATGGGAGYTIMGRSAASGTGAPAVLARRVSTTTYGDILGNCLTYGVCSHTVTYSNSSQISWYINGVAAFSGSVGVSALLSASTQIVFYSRSTTGGMYATVRGPIQIACGVNPNPAPPPPPLPPTPSAPLGAVVRFSRRATSSPLRLLEIAGVFCHSCGS